MSSSPSPSQSLLTSLLPPSHPPIEPHSHSKSKKCPVSGKSNPHAFCPAQEGDYRSVCPAINTMANHGYIPRNGSSISFTQIWTGLRACYGLTVPLALFLTSGGFFLTKQLPWKPFKDLRDIGVHGGVEHDASLVHKDCGEGEKLAPIGIIEEWVGELVGDIQPLPNVEPKEKEKVVEEVLMDEKDVARARIRREKLSPELDALHAELARGEMAIILGVWEKHHGGSGATDSQSPKHSLAPTDVTLTPSSEETTIDLDAPPKSGAPLAWVLDWLLHERLPEGWKPTRKQALLDVVRRSKIMRKEMERIREVEKELKEVVKEK